MSVARAQEILQSAYGTTHKIVPGTLVMLADQNACWAKYDEVTKGRPNPFSKQPWKNGDAKQYLPGLNGFAENGTVYIMQTSKLPTVTMHEMLHINTANGFRAAVGETVNEGTTEYLARKAATGAGVAVEGTGVAVAYRTQRAAVEKLIKLVSEDTLKSAYFGGADKLIASYEELQGPGSWATFKRAAESMDTAAIETATTTSPEGLVKRIDQLFDWVVSDSDMAQIEYIYRQAGAAQPQVADAIRKRIPDLMDMGRRAHLRAVIGS
jgi:hypothetical protein